jgi:hypothetical protein
MKSKSKKKPFQVETRTGSRRFDTKDEALRYARGLAAKGKSSRVAGPTGPLAMFSGR